MRTACSTARRGRERRPHAWKVLSVDDSGQPCSTATSRSPSPSARASRSSAAPRLRPTAFAGAVDRTGACVTSRPVGRAPHALRHRRRVPRTCTRRHRDRRARRHPDRRGRHRRRPRAPTASDTAGAGGRPIEADRALVLSGMREAHDRRSGRHDGRQPRLGELDRRHVAAGDVPEGARVTAPARVTPTSPGARRPASDDARDILERASARETAARVAAGGVAKGAPAQRSASSASRSSAHRRGRVPRMPDDPASVDRGRVEASDVRCPDAAAAARDACRDRRGARGRREPRRRVRRLRDRPRPRARRVRGGAERLDARLAGAVVSIPAIKGVEFGDGFALAARPGSPLHDEITSRRAGLPARDQPRRRSRGRHDQRRDRSSSARR